MSITNRILSRSFASMTNGMRSGAGALKALKKSPPREDEGVVLCNVRDEIEMLPHFLKHYRDIGVKRFVFVDNGSIDNTLSFLLEQGDCDVFQFPGNFRRSIAGMLWKNILLSEYSAARWYLSVDADEHAVYDGWPAVGLSEFADSMSRNGHSVVTAIMVDMYGAGPIVHAQIAPGKSLLEVCPLFDGDGYRISLPDDWRKEMFPRLNVRGGPIMRLFGEDRLGWMGKAPLILEPDIFFRDPHCVSPAGLNFAAPRIGLLHFRFLASVVEKIARVAERDMHSRGNISSYQRLGNKLKEKPDLSLAYSQSVRFESPGQFVERGMIRSKPIMPASSAPLP
jgi:hypothetical protein